MKDNDRNRAIMAEVIARSWREPAYREQLKKNPKQTLQQAGMTIAPDMEGVILENTPTVIHAVLPPKSDMERFASRLPKAVVLLTEMSDTVEVRVHRDSATRSFIVIPALPAAVKTGELTDEQLEQVAGGKHSDRDVSTHSMAVTVSYSVQTAVNVSTTATNVEAVAEVAVAAVVAPCFIS
jgi:hypothetical protein